MKKIPKYRFQEFENPWNEIKIRDIGTVNSCKRIYKDETKEEGEIPFYKIGSFGGEAEAFIDRSIYEEYKEKYSYPNFGDILVSASGTIGKTVVYKGEEAYYQDSNIIWLDIEQNKLLNPFLYYLYDLMDWSYLEGSTITRLYNKDLLNTSITIPHIKEQEKISKLFLTLDDLISAQEKQVSNLEQYKKAMLQKIYPKIGECLPEIRFDGFDGKWHEVKLDEVITKNTEKNNDDRDLPIESVSNTNGFILQEQQFEDRRVASASLKNYTIIRPKMFAYNPSRINVGSIAYKEEGRDIGVVSPLYVSFYTSEELDDLFMLNWLDTDAFEHQRQTHTEGSVRETLSYNSFSKIQIRIPTIEEQKLIGKFFKTLDDQIAAQKKKFEDYKLLKQGLLQKMFV